MEADTTSCQDNKASLSGWEFPKLKLVIQEQRILKQKQFHHKHIRVRQKLLEVNLTTRRKNEKKSV